MREKERMRRVLHTVVAALCTVIVLNGALASEAGARSTTYELDIPAQDLNGALQALALASQHKLLYRSNLVDGKSSPALKGTFTTREAMMILLHGSGLTFEITPSAVVLIRAEDTGRNGDTRTDAFTTESGAAAATVLSSSPGQEEGRDGSTTTPGTGTGSEENSTTLDEVLVTGSRLRVVGEGAFPVNVYSRKEMDRSGQSSLGGFLNTLNEVSLSSPGGNEVRFAGQTGVQLRGLPAGTTLVLINGRRVQGVGSSNDSTQFNLDLIPFPAVERIEILQVGSSAVYGGDALAGVVNVVLRDSADESMLDLRYSSADGLDDASVSLFTGAESDRGSLIVIGSYSERSPLTAAERDFFLDADYRRFGGIDTRSRSCTPGTVTSNSSSNLPGLTSTLAGIPTLAPGQPLTTDSFAPTDGQPNLCSSNAQGNGVALIAGSETLSVHSAGKFRILRDWEVFGEATFSDYAVSVDERNIGLTNVLVPETNAYNPFGTAVRVTTRLGLENGVLNSELDSTYFRTLLGVRADLWSSWELEAAISRAEDESRMVNGNQTVNTAARTAALASNDPALALNPFATGRAAGDAILDSIWTDRAVSGEGRKDILSAFLRGPVLELPAGTLDLAVGFELNDDRWRLAAPEATIDESRESRAFFAEARLPLWGPLSAGSDSPDFLALTLAGRRDDFGDFDDASTYQAGLELRPSDALSLRVARATSFRPPSLTQLNPATFSFLSEDFGLTDPLNGGAPVVGADVNLAANPELEPETGEAQTIGMVWRPTGIPGLRLSIIHWDIELVDSISFPDTPQLILDNEPLFPGFVVRGPPSGGGPGPVTSVLWSFVNFGDINVAGVDLEAQLSVDSSWGDWSFAASATRSTKYDLQIALGSPTTDRLGKLHTDAWAPDWKGQVSAEVERGRWQVALTGRYVGEYEDAGASTRELGDTWYVDIGARFRLPFARDTVFSLNVVNVGDIEPEYASVPFSNYDFTQADWRGRYVSARLSVAW